MDIPSAGATVTALTPLHSPELQRHRRLLRALSLGVVRLALAYTLYVPKGRGKGRIQAMLAPCLANAGPFRVTSRYGTIFEVSFPADHGWETLVTLRTYETGTTDLCAELVRPGDEVVDVGANLGWYTVLFAGLVGPDGCVHSFEPWPPVLERLRASVALNAGRAPIHIVSTAVGASEDSTPLYSFQRLPHGETSAWKRPGNASTSQTVDTQTLDGYWTGLGRPEVALVKVDVEGMEQAVIDGSPELLASSPPMWIFETNFETSSGFGYTPVELLEGLEQHYGYRFVRIPSAWGQWEEMARASDCRHGDNVLCYVPGRHRKRVRSLGLAEPASTARSAAAAPPEL